MTTLAGDATQLPGFADGIGKAERFNFPSGVATDPTGNIYVADTLNATIRMISPSGAVSTIAGSAGNYGMADGTGAQARFEGVDFLAFSNGVLYVSDFGANTIRVIR